MLKVSEWVKKFSKVSVILAVAGLVIKPAIFTVLADDEDFYLPVDEYDSYNAWQFFNNYGYSANESRTYNNVYTGTGSFTTSATITLSTGGGGDYADTYSSVNVIDGNYIQSYQISADVFPSTLTSTPSFTAVNPSYTMTCTSTGSGGGGGYSTGYSCTYKDLENAATYETENPWTNLLLTVEPIAGSSNYNLRLTSAETGHTEGAFTIQESSSGTYSGSGTFSFNITDQNINTLSYKLPVLSATTFNNTFSLDKNITIPSNSGINTFVILFMFPTHEGYSNGQQINGNNFISVSSSASSPYNEPPYYQGVNISSDRNANGAFSIQRINIKSANQYSQNVYIDLSEYMPKDIIPLYVGSEARMDDDLYRFAYGKDRTDAQSIQDLYNTTNDFDTSSNAMHTIESNNQSSYSSAESGISNKLNSNNNLNGNQNFLNSALWVKNRFEDLTVGTPFELVIVFSLVLGISLTIIGKLRNR